MTRRLGPILALALLACGHDRAEEVPAPVPLDPPAVEVPDEGPAAVTVADGPRRLAFHRPARVGQRFRETVEYFGRADAFGTDAMARSVTFLGLGEVTAVDEAGTPTRLVYTVMELWATDSASRLELLRPNATLSVDASHPEPRYTVGAGTPVTAEIARVLRSVLVHRQRPATDAVLEPPEPVLPGATWAVDPDAARRAAAAPDMVMAGAHVEGRYLERTTCDGIPCDIVSLTTRGDLLQSRDQPDIRGFEIDETFQRAQSDGAVLRYRGIVTGTSRPRGASEDVPFRIETSRRIDWL